MESWVRLPLSLLKREDISRSAVVLMAVLIDKADGASQVIASADELAIACGCSERTIRRAGAELIAAGLIATQRTGRELLYDVSPILPPKRRYNAAATAAPKPTPKHGRQLSQSSLNLADAERLINRKLVTDYLDERGLSHE